MGTHAVLFSLTRCTFYLYATVLLVSVSAQDGHTEVDGEFGFPVLRELFVVELV